jgi:predicted PurR-regulated permease PerM
MEWLILPSAARLNRATAVMTLDHMFSLDDRTGNAVTTVALFVVTATILYLARGVFFILLLSVLFAYLLDPAVTWVQQHAPLGPKNRASAIAQVYLVGAVVIGSVGYTFGPHLAAQIRNLNSAVPKIIEGASNGNGYSVLAHAHGLSSAQQLRVHTFLASHSDFINRVVERTAASAASVAASAIWLFAIPVLGIFLLKDGRQILDATIEGLERRGRRSAFERILRQIDTMLAKYIRAQLALAGLSFLFYSISMLVLGFPYAFALGALGGVLEFLPAVGWIASALMILTIGYLTHSHWIWMAGLVLVWRIVQNYVNSPRIMGKTLELHPLTVIVALMVGAQAGGVAGVYISVPTVAVLRIVWLEYFSTPNSTTHSDPLLTQVKA